MVLLGDSLTELSFSEEGCWGSLLANSLRRRADVVVRGFRGYTSQDFLRRLPWIVDGELMRGVAAATLLLGTNDAKKGKIGTRGVEQYVVSE